MVTTPRWVRLTGQSLKTNSPTILSGLAVAGVVATAILAAKASRKAENLVKQAEVYRSESAADPDSDEVKYLFLDTREKLDITWKVYIPVMITGTATIACIVGANQIGMRRNAALFGAYTLADTAFREYKSEVLEQIGINKERKIVDEIARKQIEAYPVSDAQIIITGGGDQLCYDTLTGRYFKSDIEKIRRAENEVNRNILRGDMYASLNEFYGLLDLGSTTLGDELGFNVEHPINVVFSSHLASDGKPCLAVGYAMLPVKDYGRVF